MSAPIIIFHHGLLFLGEPPELCEHAIKIAMEQMQLLKESGLLDAASEMHVGLNGGQETEFLAQGIFPDKAKITYHGLASRSENLTHVLIEERMKSLDGEAYIYYQHQKGSSHAEASSYGQFATNWRRRMQHHCVSNWRQCVADLDAGWEACGSHWLTGQGHDHSQHYFAGTFYWVKASFFKIIPSIFTRARIKESGIGALESRYEVEVVLGNGPRLPNVKSYYNGPLGT